MNWARSRRPLRLVFNVSLLTIASGVTSSSSSATAAGAAGRSSMLHKSSSPNNNPADSLIVNDRSMIKTIVCKEAKTVPKTHSKLIHFIRHAEGEHNVAGEANYLEYLKVNYQDAELSLYGEKQCRSLCEKIDESYPLLDDEVDLLVVSPLLRTLQTASFVFPHLMSKVKWIALECIREQTGLHPCDQRKDIKIRSKEYPLVDFSQIVSDTDPLYGQYTISRGMVVYAFSVYNYSTYLCL